MAEPRHLFDDHQQTMTDTNQQKQPGRLNLDGIKTQLAKTATIVPKSIFDTSVAVSPNETREQKLIKRAKSSIDITNKLTSVNYAVAEVQVLTSIDDKIVQLSNNNPAEKLKRDLQLMLELISTGQKSVGISGWVKKLFSDAPDENMNALVNKITAITLAAYVYINEMGDFIKALDAIMMETDTAHADLNLYITVADDVLKEKGELTKKLLLAGQNTDMFKLQEAQDKIKSIEQFEKRISYLKKIVQMSVMTIQQIRLMQDATLRLMTKARVVIEQTVPQWKKQFIAIYVSNAATGIKNVADSEKSVLRSLEEQLKAEINHALN